MPRYHRLSLELSMNPLELVARGYETVSDGIVLVFTIAGWNWLFDWLSFRSTWMRRFMAAKPLQLVKNGG